MSSPASNLFDHIIAGSIGSLSRLQESLNLTVDQITDWISSARTRTQLDSLQTLFNTQAQMMICQHRLLAVAKLAELITTATTSPETIRRARNDLLKTELMQSSQNARAGKQSNPPNPMQPPDELTQAMIRQALSELGERHLRSHDEDNSASEATDERTRQQQRNSNAAAMSLFSQKGTENGAAFAARSAATHAEAPRFGDRTPAQRDPNTAAAVSLFSQKGTEIAPAFAGDGAASPDRRAVPAQPSIAAADRRSAHRIASHSREAHGRDPPVRA